MKKGTPKSCVFIGGKQFGVDCLRILLASDKKPKLVVPNPDDGGVDTWHESLAKASRENGLSTAKETNLNSESLIERISKIKPDIIFCIGGTQILPKKLLHIPPKGCVNIHPALLPKYRGRYSIPHAIFNGDKQIGATVHFMDEGMDKGPIIAQKKITLSQDDTAKTAYEKFTSVASKMFSELVDDWVKGKTISATPQDESEATYYPLGLPNAGVLDWSWDGERVRNFIRAMTFEPFPPACFYLGQKRMVIVDDSYVNMLEYISVKKAVE